jgi:hypothetical protein
VLRATADDCEIDDAASGLHWVYDGTVELTLAEADACDDGDIAPDVDHTLRFTNFQAVGRDGDQIVETFSAPRLTQTVQPLGFGCAGSLSRVTMQGRVRIVRRDGIDIMIDAFGATLLQQADGSPCRSRTIADGRVDLYDYAGRRALRASLNELALAGSTADGYTLDGFAMVDCIGRIGFRGAEPIRLAAPCASSGRFELLLPSGSGAASSFDDGAVSLDADGDGIPERSVASCTDPSLAMCRLGADAPAH